ncbi:MAG TPA: hypothetical protein VML95_11990 [Longimicrobiales bacterium]|nr:hypothetical protein [Longimicrobiales bacterium]
MSRVYQGGIGPGTLSTGISDTDTTLPCAKLANLQAIAAPFFDVARLGPKAPSNELVQITAHTAGATTATVVRGHGGTTPRAHNAGDPCDISVWTAADAAAATAGGGLVTVDDPALWSGLLSDGRPASEGRDAVRRDGPARARSPDHPHRGHRRERCRAADCSYGWGDGAWQRVEEFGAVPVPLDVVPEFMEAVRTVAEELVP